MKRIVAVLGVLVLLVVLVIAWGVATQAGSRFLVERTDDVVPALSLENGSGTLWSGMAFSRVGYRQNGVEFAATDLSWRWRLLCLLERRVCVDSFAVDNLSVTLPPSTAGAETAASPVLAEMKFPVGLTLHALNIGRAQLSIAGTDLQLDDTRLVLDARESHVAVTKLDTQWRVGGLSGGVDASATVETTGDYPLSLELRVRDVVGRVADTVIPSSDLVLSLRDSVASLAVEAQLDGLARASLVARVQPLEPSVPLDAELAVASARWPPEGGGAINITDASLSAQGSIEQLEMALSGTLGTPRVDPVGVSWAGDVVPTRGLERSRFRLDALDGSVSGDLSVAWLDGLSIELDALADGINPEQIVPDLTGQIGGRIVTALRNGPADAGGLVVDQLTVDLEGLLREQPVSLTGDASVRDGTVRVQAPGLNLAFGDNRAVVVGSVGDTFAVSSSLDFSDLSQILPRFRGEARGEVALSGARDRPSVSAALRADGVRVGNTGVQQLRLDGELMAGGEAPSSLALDWRGLTLGAQTLEAGALAVTGDRGAHRATAVVDSDLAQAEWQLEGRFEDASWHGRILDSWLAVAGHRWSNTGPVGVSVSDSGALIDAHCWQSVPAHLCLDSPANLAASGSAKVRLAELPVEWLTEFLPDPVPLSGVLDGDLDVVWADGGMPSVRSRIGARRLATVLLAASGEQVPIALGDLTLSLSPAAGDVIRATVDSAGGALGEARVSLLVPLDQPGQYRGDIQWQGLQLAALQPLLPSLDSLAGELSVDARVRGEASGPVFDGGARLRGGELRGLDLPTEVFGAWVDVGFSGKQAKLSGGWQSEADAASDAVSLEGAINWAAVPALDLRFFGAGLPVDYRPWVRAAVDPDISITATAERVTVRGRVAVPQADIEIVAPESQPPTPSTDTVLLDEAAAADGDGRGGMALDLDVDVLIRDEVSLSGFGFDSRLQGAIGVRMAPRQPLQLFGDLSILDGRYQAWGQNLAVERGELVFSGPPETAVVDAIAWRELDAVRAGVAVAGQVASPDVRVISEPAMSDQEALSYLVLGRAWGEAGDQQVAIARAALALGLERSGGLTNRVADGLGLQRLSVEAQGSGENTSAVINAQLNDKLSVQYGVGVFVPFRTLTARYQLGKQLYVEAIKGVGSALDLFYSFEF